MKYSIVLFSSLCSVIPLCLCIAPVQSQCLAHQRSLLLHLKESLQFNSSLSTKLVTWSSDHDCCGWAGVTCDHLGRVTGLDLSSELIFGGINSPSSHLFRLQYLETLNLANNSFWDESISSGFGNLSSLRCLTLSDAGFAGQIPIEISYLTRLVTLDISSRVSHLELEKPNLEKLVQNLTGLIQLHLDGVNISSMGEKWCPVLSSSLPNLQVLSLIRCDLSGPICSALQNLHSLSSIDLGHNYGLYGPVPDFFANFTNLTRLRLSDCGFRGTFPEKIFQLSTLQTVDLSLNSELQGTLPEFPRNGSLQELNLRGTDFSGPIPNSMLNLTRLEYVDFSDNMFTGPAPSFRMSRELYHLDLSYNQLTGTIPSTHFEGLSKLEVISLSSNSFNGSVPSSLFELPSLRILDLSFNQFGGRVDEFSNASSSQLAILDLSVNNLQGPIPMSFWELASLEQLALSSNNFSGTIGLQAIRRPCYLRELQLSNNSLSLDTSESNLTFSCNSRLKILNFASCKQQVFPDLTNLSNLKELDLSNNQIVGEIPNWIWEVGLIQLNLSHNLFTRVQEPFVFPTDLDILDLHSNQLSGEIPTPKERANASYIDYSGNNFSSTIPVDIGNNLINLVFFSLSNNFIKGTIPRSLCNASDLLHLDLSNNDLSGTMPSCPPERHLSRAERPILCSLQVLYLDGNHLEGQVPKSLVNCSNLEVLNLGKNDISDRFPCFLKNLPSLRILVLQSNHFHGDTHCEGDERGGWPSLQVIDLSFNSFDGSLPQTFFSDWRAMMDQNSKANYLQINDIARCFATAAIDSSFSSCYHAFIFYEKATVTNKGLKMVLDKILSSFTYIDFSSNRFHGKIPDSIGDLKSLIALNLSRNAFAGTIPVSLGNLKHLESLDLSKNKPDGRIPLRLASLTFLSFLNLSDNLLVGMIPTGGQFDTFDSTSFQGNKALCGAPPINQGCKDAGNGGLLTPSHDGKGKHSFLEHDVYVSVEVEFILGLASTVGPIVFSGRWSRWYYRQVDRFLPRNWEQRRRQRRYYSNPILRLLHES